ncbi:VOC family protein [Caulobacter segnis]|uniref:Glyoxalase/bleomycin resistance/extradiol dioxygenase family protein n=1 Tax=Caulobacter segnis TaxID=88688 RepID=A0A2W5UY26_9CAUL|nr:VOC family protein [Caulobacter segnis]PZR31427.1 MAG: glyoxalase/bleomycin resistance/extradiol dioxygenase family protein [Caulobacter segnis]
MIDHIGVTASDLKAAKVFYDAALAPLGLSVVLSVTAEQTGGAAHLGYGATPARPDLQIGKPNFWISEGTTPTGAMHVAFLAADRAQVDAFHAAALAAGGTDNGPPGLRPHYHPNYYGAFVLDPDGRNVEAVCHAPA